MPTLLPLLEKRLNGNPARSGWVVGGNMTLADMMLFDLLWNWFLSPDRKAEHADKVSKRLKAAGFDTEPKLDGVLAIRR